MDCNTSSKRRSKSKRRIGSVSTAFSLIEVVLAIAIVASTMLVVIAVLGAQSQNVQMLRKSEEVLQQQDKTDDLLGNLNPFDPKPNK